jgi:hypothetical protein
MMQFTLQDDQLHSGYANNTHEEEKILVKNPAELSTHPQQSKLSHSALNTATPLQVAARAIKAHNTSTKVIFYHMAWQDFPQFDLYNLTLENALTNHWAVTWDNGTVPGVFPNGTAAASGRLTYNHSNPGPRDSPPTAVAPLRSCPHTLANYCVRCRDASGVGGRNEEGDGLGRDRRLLH